MNDNKTIIVEGPDNCGKTAIAKALAATLWQPYFRMSTQHENWRKGGFLNALRYDQTYLSSLLLQTGVSLVIDRAYPSEFVYSRVFERETDMETLRNVDLSCAGAGVTHLICVRRNYTFSHDELVPSAKLPDIHNAYVGYHKTTKIVGQQFVWDEPFIQWTQCPCIVIYVDDFDNDVSLQVPLIAAELQHIWNGKGGDITYLMRRSWGRRRLRIKRKD